MKITLEYGTPKLKTKSLESFVFTKILFWIILTHRWTAITQIVEYSTLRLNNKIIKSSKKRWCLKKRVSGSEEEIFGLNLIRKKLKIWKMTLFYDLVKGKKERERCSQVNISIVRLTKIMEMIMLTFEANHDLKQIVTDKNKGWIGAVRDTENIALIIIEMNGSMSYFLRNNEVKN